MRDLLGPIGRWLLRPAWVGASYMLVLSALAAMRGAAADEALGGQTRAISRVVETRFGDEITRAGVAIVAAAVALGALLGVASMSVIALRDRMARRRSRSAANLALTSLCLTALTQALCEAWAMAEAPQLYAEGWYGRGGILRTAQVLLTDVIGPRGVVVVGLALLVVFLAGPPAHWKRWPGRFARALFPRQRLGKGAATSIAIIAGLAAVGMVGLRAPMRIAAADPSPEAASSGDRKLANDLDRTGEKPPPNIILLAADSLRADRIDPRVAPNLAHLADRGTRFDRAYVSLPRTFPSWVTLLTGRHPYHHGIRSMFPRWEERAKDFDAVPARLARAGYSTSVVSDYAGDIFDRIDLGWTSLDTPTFNFRQLIRQRALERQTPLLPFLHSGLGRAMFPVMRELATAADPAMLAEDAVRAIRRARGKPFFLTVFFSTAHFPYAAPAPFYGKFARDAYRGRFKYHRPVGLERDAPPDAEDIAQIRALYDGAVASVDAAAARVLEALDDEGIAKNTIVIVTADHGETLYENGHGAGHGDHLFGDEGTHVPLIVFDPRRPRGAGEEARRVASVVRDVDLAPTLYELAGVDAPSDLDGRSLVSALSGATLAPKLAYAETGLWFTEDIDGLPSAMRLPYPGVAAITEIDPEHDDEVVLARAFRPIALAAKHRMVRDERWKLVYAPTRAGAKYFLYDTQADPGETRDVRDANPLQLARLEGELWSWMLADREMVARGGYLVPREAPPAPFVGTP